MKRHEFSRVWPGLRRKLPIAVLAATALLTAQGPAGAADNQLADAIKGFYQIGSGRIASPRPASFCGDIASCVSADGGQSLKLVADVVTAPEFDAAAELSACEDMAKMFQPQTRKQCEAVADRADATPRQRARAFTRLAFIVQRQRGGTFADFLAMLAKAIQADPTYPAPRLARADHLILSNKSGAAMDELKEVLKIDPNNAEAHLDLGRVHSFLSYVVSGRWEQLGLAYKEMTTAINLGLSGPDAYYFRGSVLEEAGRFLDAAQDYAKAAALYDPMPKTPVLMGYGDPVIHLAGALARAERPSMVVETLAGVETRRLPDFVKSQLLAQRAEAEDKIGKFADAVKDMTAAVKFASPDKRAALYVRQSEMLQHAGQTNDATKKMTEALDGADLRTVLRVQVLLRNHGYVDVEITGKMDPVTHKVAVSCFAKPECGSGISHFI